MWTNNIDDADRLSPGDAIVSMQRRMREGEEPMKETPIEPTPAGGAGEE
jgi:hypothetical protein